MRDFQLTAVWKYLSSCKALPMHRMCDLLMANQAGTELGPRSFNGVAHNLYINRDSVESLHHLLNVQVGHSAATPAWQVATGLLINRCLLASAGNSGAGLPVLSGSAAACGRGARNVGFG